MPCSSINDSAVGNSTGRSDCLTRASNVHNANGAKWETWILLPFLALLIVVENGLVCLAFGLDKKLRKRPANILVCSQACADLINGLLFIPVYGVEQYGEKLILTPFVICYVLFVSLFNLFALALDRYLALIKPLLHHLLMDVSRTVKMLCCIWSIPFVATLIPLCWWFESDAVKVVAQRVYLSSMWLFMFVLCSVMIVMYGFIYLSARKTIRQRRQTIASYDREKQRHLILAKKELRVTHLFGLLLIFFVLAYLPILYMNFMDLIKRSDMIPLVLMDLSLYSLIINSVVNPILCMFLKKDYQAVIRGFLCTRLKDKRGSGSFHTSSFKTEDNADTQATELEALKLKREKALAVLTTTPPYSPPKYAPVKSRVCNKSPEQQPLSVNFAEDVGGEDGSEDSEDESET